MQYTTKVHSLRYYAQLCEVRKMNAKTLALEFLCVAPRIPRYYKARGHVPTATKCKMYRYICVCIIIQTQYAQDLT